MQISHLCCRIEFVIMINEIAEFVKICNSDIPEERKRIKNETISEDVLFDVIQHFPELTLFVIHNNSVTLKILEILSKSPDSEIRWWVATKRKLSPELIEILSTDEDESVRHRIAYNVNTSKSILTILAQDNSIMVAKVAKDRLLKNDYSV